MGQVPEYLEFTNSTGASVRLGEGEIGLVSVEGLGDVGADMQMQTAPYQDGSTFIDSVFEPRYISVEFIVDGKDYGEVGDRRRSLAAILSPKLGLGTLKYVSDDFVRVIDVVAESVPYYPDADARGKRWQRGMINLIAPNPYWKSTTVIEEPMAAFVELFQFPSDEYWQVGEDGDLYFEVGFEGEKREFIVEGDAPVPIEITFHGPLLNPTLRNNTTGQLVGVNARLNNGDTLVIDTEKKTMLMNGIDYFPYINLESEFWSLQVGSNEIQYFADEGIESARLEIRWQERYVAV